MARKSHSCAFERKQEKWIAAVVPGAKSYWRTLNSSHMGHALFCKILLYMRELKNRKLPRVETKTKFVH